MLVPGFRFYFRFDQSTFADRHWIKLREIVDAWRAQKQTSFFISAGYADAMGVDRYNEILAHRRAESVKRALVKLGVPADLIHTESYGNKQAKHLRRDLRDYWKDRRVDIYEK